MSCFSFLFHRKRSCQNQNSDGNRDNLAIAKITIYSYKELRKATGDFSLANKIGQGGFGSVYKGRLKDGTLIAVKVLSAESRQGVREFVTELNVISHIVHENLVILYGCCVEGDHRILVYNYLENNSLTRILLGARSTGQSNIQFNWRTRVKICLGVARGLAFLHEEVNPHIVHRDIKASNILLDKDLNPKISDFGLARFLPPDTSHVSTRVAGTLGYLAPEYAIRGQATRKSDVYSFGVLLLEIVSGRCNINTSLPYADQFLLEKAWSLYEQGEIQNIIDPTLNEDLDIDQACRFMIIGLLCTQDVAKLRPTMQTVVKMLNGEGNVDLERVTRPAVLSDFMEVKVKLHGQPSSTLSSFDNSYSSPGSMTFTAISERSN